MTTPAPRTPPPSSPSPPGQPSGQPSGPRRARVITGLCVAVALVLAVAGTVYARDRPGSGPSYVALGDSYSAGPLIPDQINSAGSCERSTNSYPHQVATGIAASSFTDASCVGASPANVTSAQVVGGETHAPQLDAIDASTQLVTLGIGANDQNVFSGLLLGCAAVAPSDPTGAPCRDRFVVHGDDTVTDKVAQTRVAVTDAIRAVHTKAPGADIVVVGYPRIVPTSGSCPAVLPFAVDDYAYIDRWEHELNAALQEAASDTQASYVDTYTASLGHDACAGANAWITGMNNTGTSAAYHPNLAGMTGEAKIVQDYLRAHSLLHG